MSSERRRYRTGPLALGLALLLALVGCGRKGDPQPPPRKNPERISDLEVRQTGHELVLTMSYPTMTTGGLALPGITRLELLQYTRPAPEFMEQPEPVGAEGEETDAAGGEEGQPLEGEPEADEGSIGTDGPAQEPTAEETTDDAEAVEQEVEAESAEGETAEGEPAEDDETDETEDPATPAAEANPFLRIRIDAKEFDKQAETIVVLQDAELDAAVVGGTIEIRLSLEEIATEPPVAYAFSVETSAGRLRSPPSRTVAFVPLPPPPSPKSLALSAGWQGIRLTWEGVESEMLAAAEAAAAEAAAEPEADDSEPEDASAEAVSSEPLDEQTGTEDAEDEPLFEGYRILRRLEESPGYDEPIAVVEPGVSDYLDAGIAFGRTYVYTVTTMLMERPLVESAPAEEQQIEHRDVYPPDTPVGLVALAEAGRVRLLWDTGRARDIAGYLIFVSENGGTQRQLTAEPLAATEFTHQGTVSGTTYTYFVRAVDNTGNISEPSEPVTTRAP